MGLGDSDLPVTRVILAAGRGSRMGRTKALLDFEGHSALRRIVELRIPALMRSVVVIGHDAVGVRREARRIDPELPVCHHAGWTAGQTSSLQAGLRYFETPSRAFLLHPVDLPLIRNEDYIAAWEAYREREKEILAGSNDETPVLAATSVEIKTAEGASFRRGHPILFDHSVAEELLALGPDDSPRPVFARHQGSIRHAVVENPWVRQDLDHPADYERAQDALAPDAEHEP